MTFLKENYPLIAFIATYLITRDLFLAAAIWSGGSLLQIITSLVVKEPIKKMHLAMFAFGLSLLAMAYYFNDDTFIKWKTSVMFWLAGLFILFRQIFNQKYLFLDIISINQQVEIKAPDEVCKKINLLWIMTFLAFGGLNLWVAYNYSTDFWFYFKLGGIFVCLLFLFIFSFVKLAKYLPEEFFEDETPEDEHTENLSKQDNHEEKT